MGIFLERKSVLSEKENTNIVNLNGTVIVIWCTYFIFRIVLICNLYGKEYIVGTWEVNELNYFFNHFFHWWKNIVNTISNR